MTTVTGRRIWYLSFHISSTPTSVAHIAPGGRLFVNVPVNSPSPDHIYLLNTPEEAVTMVRNSGYEIAEQRFFPMTGHSETRARKNKLSISCVIVGIAPA